MGFPSLCSFNISDFLNMSIVENKKALNVVNQYLILQNAIFERSSMLICVDLRFKKILHVKRVKILIE